MSNVSYLAERRTPSSTDPLTCRCGSVWFDLVGRDGQPPAVTVNLEGTVTGYAGELACRSCGMQQLP